MSNIVRAARRPIDKELKFVAQTLGTAQVTTVLKTTTFPCTITGLRWDMSATSNLTTGASTMVWAIVITRDGNAVSTMSQSNGSDFYTPEQDVLTFGVRSFPDADLNGPLESHWVGSTKTMRKLKQGDVLNFIALGTAAAQGTVRSVVQFFCKS